MPAWAILFIAVIGATLAAFFLWRVGPPRGGSPLLLAATAGLIWTALQLVPLPAGVLRFLSPRTVEPVALEQGASAALLLDRAPPTWAPITASVPGTRESLVFGGALLAFVLAGTLAVEDGRRRSLVAAIASSTLLMGAVILLHTLVGAANVYGIVEPPVPLTVVSPLFNENHAAAFLALGVPCCLGLAFGTRTRTEAIAWFVGAGLGAAASIACISRGGLIGLVVSLGSFAVLRVASNRAKGPKRIATPPIVIAGVGVVLLGIGLTIYAGLESLSYDLRTTTLNKIRYILYGLDLAARAPWVGVGRGGYSTALVHLSGSDLRFEYAECFPVQWAAEWGFPFALAMIVVLVVLSFRGVRSELSAERVGALAALAGLATHELVDFSTERLGVGSVAALLVAAALTGRGTTSTATVRSRGANVAYAIPVVSLLLTIVPGASIAGARVAQLRADLTVVIERGDDAAVDRQLRRALELHPGEPIFTLLGAYAHARRGDPRTPEWLNATMVLAPRWFSPHVIAAEWLAHRGHRDQAWLEVREAERSQATRGSGVACALLVTPADADEGLRVMGAEPNGIAFLDVAAEYCASMPAATSAHLVSALLERRAPRASRRAAWAEIAAGRPEAALELLRDLDEDQDGWIRLARVDALLAAGRAADAVAEAEAAEAPGIPVYERLGRLAHAQTAARDAEGMRSTIQRLQGEAGGQPSGIAQALILLGDLESELGNRDRAAVAYDRADTIDPTSGALVHAIGAATAAGDLHHAGDLRARLCARTPGASGC
jgi:hypothetical protein